MGWLSSIKKAIKKVVRAVKTIIRVVVKIVIGVVMRIINTLGAWIPVDKKLRLQVFILRNEIGNEVDQVADVEMAVNRAIATFKQRFDVNIKAYGKPVVQVLKNPAPAAALDVPCDGGAWLEEFGEMGEYFAANLAGWNAIPISLTFPVSVFIVRTIDGKIGCSIPIADYVVLSPAGVDSDTTLAHELAHTCLLMHRDDSKNLLFPNIPRGTDVTGWQRFVVRTSRHCTFW